MRILLATDGSNDAKAAAAFLNFTGMQTYHDAVAAEGPRVVDEARGTLSVRAAIEMPEGHPAEMLTAGATEPDPDLIVVGAQGIGGVKRWLLGSVSENVLRAARGPVLIVKRPREGDGRD